MAVYTTLEAADLEALLADFDLGRLVAFQGIAGGIENTNYFVDTQDGDRHRHWVLTLFEELDASELPFFIALAEHLAACGIPVPAPRRDRHHRALQEVANRPALLLPRLPGRHLEAVAPRHCHELGACLARFHLAGRDFPRERAPHRGPCWWRQAARRVSACLSTEDAGLLQAEVDAYDQGLSQAPALPRGPIHGDLFVDNALFDRGRLGGIIDLYNACTGFWLFDLAVAFNDWCSLEDGHWDLPRAQALLGGYLEVRPLSTEESTAWPLFQRTAAMRFWLSRLMTWHGLEAPGSGTTPVLKDPAPMKRILLARKARPAPLPAS